MFNNMDQDNLDELYVFGTIGALIIVCLLMLGLTT